MNTLDLDAVRSPLRGHQVTVFNDQANDQPNQAIEQAN